MKKKIVGLILLSVAFCCQHVFAQGVKDIRINEVLVYNDSSCTDNFGVRSGWIELYNTGKATAKLGGCYITNDPSNPKKYRIPKSEVNANVAPGGYMLLYAYNEPTRSAFHVSFFLDDTSFLGNDMAFLAIYDQSGIELIDSITYKVGVQMPDMSFGRIEGDYAKDKGTFGNLIIERRPPMQILPKATPAAVNTIVEEKTRSELQAERDPHGVVITITSMSVVFFLLFVVAMVFMGTGKYFKKQNKKKEAPQPVAKAAVAEAVAAVDADNSEELAAIATALHLYYGDLHEEEPTGFYPHRVANHPSAWENKSLIFKKSPIRK